MGLKCNISSADPRWIRTGLAAGAARPSTGFAFKRIQHWAQLCAEAIINGRLGFDFQSDNRVLKWMDNIFLNAIKENPAIAPLLFISLAHNVPPDKLARFLTDRPKYGDYFSIIRALPKLPLLRYALTEMNAGMLSVFKNKT
jgi:lycopene beta-cyclase